MNTQTSNIPRVDWSVLYHSLIVLTLTVIVSTLLILGSQQYDTSELNQCQVFNKKQEDTSRHRETLEIVGKNPVHYDTNYKELVKDGFFQKALTSTIEEQRLKMIADIEALIPQLLLPMPAHYEPTQATPYTTSNVTTENQFKAYETKLILKLGLLHEEDVLKLIETIEFQKLSGLFNWQQCDIKRTTDKINLKEIKANFEATCVLAWYISTIEPESK